MDVGLIGLGKMGANMATRWIQHGHRVVANARTQASVDKLVAEGAEGAYSQDELVEALDAPRIVWLMVPEHVVDGVFGSLVPLLAEGDLVVDGGNSWYKETLRRARELADAGIEYVDVGTSGGVWGLTEGYSMMVGGGDDAVARIRPLLECLAPAPDKGWGHVGPVGSGHFVKMVHNGIEYGMMQAYAEGFSIMEAKEEFGLDLHQVAEIWRFGSVVRSWLLDLAADALSEDTELADIAPYVPDSGEGRWTVAEAIELDRAAPVITQALLERLASRDDRSYANRMLSVLRNQFGGHDVKKEE
jgi:6-phosphogluconate dehydrogenase